MSKICVELMSRLGNQMFQLATGYHLAKQYDKDLEIKERCDKGYEQYSIILDNKTIVENTIGYYKIEEPKNQKMVDLSIAKDNENVVIKGYFQSDKYFTREDANELFPIPEEIKEKYKYLEDKVCLSVRRGDYLQYPNLFISPSINWFKKCYEKYFDGKQVVIASDDINWCKNNFDFKNQEFIENDDPVETLLIKAMCKNHIISPSSYAWWSAYLSNGKVVAPSDWVGKYLKQSKFNEEDKYVDGWIKEPLI